MAGILQFFATKKNVTVTQKYLVSGHTMMEVDSVHANIQRRLPTNVYVPRDIEVAVQAARVNPRPYAVRHMRFYDFLKLESNPVKSIRPGRRRGDPKVHQLRALR